MFHRQATMNKLGDFIADELRQRNMSARQFAQHAGVSHSTITKAMYKVPPDPTLDFLSKLARATHTDLCALVALVKPDDTKVRPEIQLIADRIARLSENDRQFLDTYLRGVRLTPGE